MILNPTVTLMKETIVTRILLKEKILTSHLSNLMKIMCKISLANFPAANHRFIFALASWRHVIFSKDLLEESHTDTPGKSDGNVHHKPTSLQNSLQNEQDPGHSQHTSSDNKKRCDS